MAKHKTRPRPELDWRLVPSGQLLQMLGISYSTLKRWKKTGAIIEGIHYQFLPGSRTNMLYNLDLLRDFIACGGNSIAHQRSIESYLNSLPSTKAA
jgi:hypothetical protein